MALFSSARKYLQYDGDDKQTMAIQLNHVNNLHTAKIKIIMCPKGTKTKCYSHALEKVVNPCQSLLW